MSEQQRDLPQRQRYTALGTPGPFRPAVPGVSAPLRARPAGQHRTVDVSAGSARVTASGADWLASACAFPRSVHALWQHRPGAPGVLPCGTVFDVISTAPLFGRRVLDRLWAAGPGSGPAALHRGRILLFAAPGTAQRLPALLRWEEWRDTTDRAEATPALLCHGLGDSVTVPAPRPAPGASDGPGASRWLVAPDLRHPWLPGPDVLVWACVRTLRDLRSGGGAASGPGHERPIFTTEDRGANVYDVSRRR